MRFKLQWDRKIDRLMTRHSGCHPHRLPETWPISVGEMVTTKPWSDGIKTFMLLESQMVSLVKSIELSRNFLWCIIIIRYVFYEVSEWRMGLNSGCLKVECSEWCFLGPDPWIRVAGSPWFPSDPRWPTDAWHCLALQWPPAKPVGTLLHQEDAVQRGLGHAVGAHLGPSVWVS